MQQGEQPQLREPADNGTADAGEQTEHGQLQAEQHQGFPAGQSQAAQQRTGIKAAGGEARRRQCHGDTGQQHRDQAGHVQVALSLAQRAANLPVTVAGILDALVGGQAGFDQLSIGFQCLGVAAPELAVTDPAAGLHNAGGGEVAEVDQYARRQAVEVAGAVGFVGQHARHCQGFHAHIDAVADFQVQRRQQSGFDPGFAGFRAASGFFRGEGGGGAFQFAAQWINVVGSLDAGQLNAVIGGDDAGELHHLRVLETQLGAAVDLFRARRRTAFQHQVGPQEFGGAQHHGAVQASAEVTDGSTRGHGHQ
ncbi:hypothetical protein D3C87_1360760 [compost metagenome]